MSILTSRLRLSAIPAAVHLSLSLLVALLAMAAVFFVWYPEALAGAQGVDRLILIMIGVDVVLGPLMTLIVFNPAKNHLWFDLMVIAGMQTAALLYGMAAIFGGRPAYVVFNVDRFDVVAVQDVDRDSLQAAMDEGKPGISWFGPRWVAAPIPDDPQRAQEILFSSVGGGADLPQLPDLFVPLKADREQMLRRLRPLDELRKINELDAGTWADYLQEWGGRPESEMGYLPMNANAREGAVIMDARTAEIIDVVLLTPSFAPLKKDPESSAPETPSPTPNPRPMASPGVG